MEKKNLLWSLLAMMMVAMSCCVMTACSSDDDNEDTIIGTWTGIDGNRTLALSFKSGNVGNYTSKYEDPNAGSETKTGTFTYTPESSTKGILIMKVYGSNSGSSTEVFYYMIDGQTMRLYKNDYYDDLEWTLAKNGVNQTDTSANNAIGTWGGADDRETLTLIFNSGNSGEYIYKYENNGTLKTDASTFVYVAESAGKGVLVLKFSASYTGSSAGIFFYVIDGNTMRLYDQGYYDGLKWTLTKQ